MSRIFVKNLPKNITESKIREFFSGKGEITDVQMKFNKEGKFRSFAFIGYKSDEQAKEACEHYDRNYIQTSQIKVELCKKDDKEKEAETEKIIETKGVKEEFDNLKQNPEFLEFLKVQRNLGEKKAIWDDDVEINQDLVDSFKKNREQKKIETSSVEEKPKKKKKNSPKDIHKYTLAVRKIPKSKRNKTEIRAFFQPFPLSNIRIPKEKTLAYVSFATEKDLKAALVKHKSFLGKNQLLLQIVNTEPENEKESRMEFNKKKSRMEKIVPVENIEHTGRLFVRNLSYQCKQEDLEALFNKYGPTTEVNLPVDEETEKLKGFAFVTFMFPEHAIQAFTELDRSTFQGRLLHILPAEAKYGDAYNETPKDNSFKKRKADQMKADSGKLYNWNSLFLGANAVAELMSSKLNLKKSKLLLDDVNQKDSIAARVALGETQLVSETKQFLESNGVCLNAFDEQDNTKRSKTTFLIKNLPANSSAADLEALVSTYGKIKRFILPPSGVTALVEMANVSVAQNAFQRLAYAKFKRAPLYLEWAPENVFNTETSNTIKEKPETQNASIEDDEQPEENTVLFVKNLAECTNESSLRTHFAGCGRIFKTSISEKRGPDGVISSLGYGFVQFYREKDAKKALRKLELSLLDGNAINIKLSANSLATQQQTSDEKKKKKEQVSTKIIVKNVPFEASEKDVTQLFRPFGHLQSVRLPKKLVGSGSHRGFAFVEFSLKEEAKKAMEALSQSTHLYGRRLVLDWAKSDSN